MRISFITSQEQIDHHKKQVVMLKDDPMNIEIVPWELFESYMETDERVDIIASHLRNHCNSHRPKNEHTVDTQELAHVLKDGGVMVIELIVDFKGNRFMTVLRSDREEECMSVSYHGDRYTFVNYCKVRGIQETDFVDIKYYMPIGDEDGPISPWVDRNQKLIDQYNAGEMTPLLNNMMRIFNSGFKYTWSEEDDDLIELYNEEINQEQIDRLMRARSDYSHLVNQLAAPVASGGLLQYLKGEKDV